MHIYTIDIASAQVSVAPSHYLVYHIVMLRTSGFSIVDENGKRILLKGICFGGWLMMEGYMLGGKNIPEHIFKTRLSDLFGKEYPVRFTKMFRDAFVTQEDMIRVKEMGFNCVRLPFNCRLIKEKGGLELIKGIISLLAKYELYVILDMHSVPGSQNADWHSDSGGKALFFKENRYIDEYLRLWKILSKEFKSEKWIAGYDVMNEPVTDRTDILRSTYRKVIDVIRSSGDDHIVFLEGNNWAIDIDALDSLAGKNIALSAHFYQPIQFTCNWMPETKYPGSVLGVKWDKKRLHNLIKAYVDFAKKRGMPLYMGEFGVASRCDICGSEYGWLEDILKIFEKYGVHWTYWTYKSVKGMRFPDGLFQISDASGVLQNHASTSGMERLYETLGKREEEFFSLINTKNFLLNKRLYSLLKNHL